MKVEKERVWISVPGFGEPASLPLERARSLVVLRSQPPEIDRDRLAGRLEVEGTRLRGRLADGRGGSDISCLAWRPLGTDSASRLRPETSGRIFYREAPAPARPAMSTTTTMRVMVAPRVAAVPAMPAEPIIIREVVRGEVVAPAPAPAPAPPANAPPAVVEAVDRIGAAKAARAADAAAAEKLRRAVARPRRLLLPLLPRARCGGELPLIPLCPQPGAGIRSRAPARAVAALPGPAAVAPVPALPVAVVEVRPLDMIPAQQVAMGGMMVQTQTQTRQGGARSPAGTLSLHLRTGDIIPCQVTKIDETGLWFRTPHTDNTFVAADKIKAVELAPESLITVRLDKIKRERLLTLPRMQKESPPTHLIRSKNGDYLRGRVVGLDDKTLQVEIHLETKSLPRDRISRIIWLHADEVASTEEPAKEPSKEASKPAPAIEKGMTRVQALRSDGIRMTCFAERR